MTARTGRTVRLLLGLAGAVVLAFAWRAHDRAALLLLLQSLPLCG